MPAGIADLGQTVLMYHAMYEAYRNMSLKELHHYLFKYSWPVTKAVFHRHVPLLEQEEPSFLPTRCELSPAIGLASSLTNCLALSSQPFVPQQCGMLVSKVEVCDVASRTAAALNAGVLGPISCNMVFIKN
eukprot:338725-Pelagomonas_calceolata.AAC.4